MSFDTSMLCSARLYTMTLFWNWLRNRPRIEIPGRFEGLLLLTAAAVLLTCLGLDLLHQRQSQRIGKMSKGDMLIWLMRDMLIWLMRYTYLILPNIPVIYTDSRGTRRRQFQKRNYGLLQAVSWLEKERNARTPTPLRPRLNPIQ